ncbi:MAG TPA: 50S ribosomal protein L29 [Dongiaceae bacterium]|nr:50S ribosomal protein L29 [Dongiaceae bacterium]
MTEAKKTTKKTVEATEVKDVTTLRADLAAKQQDLLDSRKSHRAGELVNPRVLGTIRKEIARLHTAIRAAEQAAKESK